MTDTYELHERYAILLEENGIADTDTTAKKKYWNQAKAEIAAREGK